MQQQTAEGIVKGNVLHRLAGVSFIVGAILTGVLAALEPGAADPSNVAEVLTETADNETLWKVILLGLAVGMWAIMIGVVGVYRSVTTGGAADWTRLGFYGVIVGTTLLTAAFAIQIAGVNAAVDWAAAGSVVGTSEYSIGATLYKVITSAFNMAFLVFWLALAFLAIGMILSRVYPQWLSWPPLILGVALVAVLIPQAFVDPTETSEIIFAIPGGLTSVWALVIGVWITRKAW